MNAEEGKLVCVTGGSGYIASWLVKELLLRGYAVKASVRNLNDPKKTGHLLKLQGAKERLHLFEADLLKEGSFDSAINGCEAVFHTASPCFAVAQDPQRELLEPAAKGTLNVLASCANNSSVKRVIVTSSAAAIVLNDNPKTPQTIVDETWFSDPEYCRKTQSWYALSKTLAEEAAWKFAREKGLDLISINPGMVIGPLLQPTLNHSCETILNLINGSKTYQNFTHSWVHVKDVVETHIRAFEEPSASGRYYLAESVLHYREIVQMLKEIYPHLQVPTKCDDDKPLMPTYQIAKEKVKSLGIDYIPLKIGLQETFESLKEKKFVTF